MQPLSRTATTVFERRRNELPGNAHKGLIFERFYNGYGEAFRDVKGADNQQLNQLVGPAGDSDQIDDAIARRIQMVTALGGEFGVFGTDWHFVTGMGNAHPAENGFSWHPVLGTPYIPGSGVKGLLRAWMETCVSDENQSGGMSERVHEWFGRNAGTQGSSDSGKSGDLIFFDALPVERPSVAVDIMTPHMGKWYEQGGEIITAESTPGDWHNPVPVSFLVTTESRFLFAVAPRISQAAEAAREAMENLRQALAWLGAGAKTAAGYGHMSYDEQDTQRRKQNAEAKFEEAQARARLASMSPGQRVLNEIEQHLAKDQSGKVCEPGGNCKRLLREASEQAGSWPTEERESLLDLAKRVLNHHDGDKWKKKDKPKALYQKIRQLIE